MSSQKRFTRERDRCPLMWRIVTCALFSAPVVCGCKHSQLAGDAQLRALEGGRKLDTAVQEYQSGHIENALAATQQARQTDPSLAEAYELEALMHADLGHHEEYVSSLRNMIAAHPRSANLQSAAGRMLISAGKRAEGLESMQRAVRLAPGETAYARDLASVYLDAGDLTTAAAVLTAAQIQNPRDPALAVSLARLYETAGDWQRAAATYRVAAELEPRNALWRRQNAKCLYRLQQFPRAADEFQQCLEIDVTAMTVSDRVEFSDACLRCGDLKRAQWLLDELVREGHETREVVVLRGVCALRRNAPAEAEQIFERAMSRWPEDQSLALLLDNSRQDLSRILPTSAAVLPADDALSPASDGWLPPVARLQP